MFLQIFLLAALGAEPQAAFITQGAVDEAVLEQSTAREDVNQISTSEQSASVSSSSVNGVSETGTATFSDNAFQNVSGLTVVNANTGNNVAINGAIVVNVSIVPAPTVP